MSNALLLALTGVVVLVATMPLPAAPVRDPLSIKLYTTIHNSKEYIFSAGPVPYDMAECRRRIKGLAADRDKVLRTGIGANGQKATKEDLAELRSWRFDCEYFSKPPVIKDPIEVKDL